MQTSRHSHPKPKPTDYESYDYVTETYFGNLKIITLT
jgi:hypothetical protein